MENNFFSPKILIGEKVYFVSRLSMGTRSDHREEFGKILSLDRNGLTVSCQGGTIIVHEISNSVSQPIELSEFVAINDVALGETRFEVQ